MTSAAKKILEAALALPSGERADLIEALTDSLDASESRLSDAWRIEIARRVEAIERGESHLIPGDEVDARLRAALDASLDESWAQLEAGEEISAADAIRAVSSIG